MTITLPEWALSDADYEHAAPIHDRSCLGGCEWGHCTVCGTGIMYGSRCAEHPLMAGWSPEYRQTWLAKRASASHDTDRSAE